MTSGCSGFPKFMQLTSALGTAARAGDVAGRLEHHERTTGAGVEPAEARLAVGGDGEARAPCP